MHSRVRRAEPRGGVARALAWVGGPKTSLRAGAGGGEQALGVGEPPRQQGKGRRMRVVGLERRGDPGEKGAGWSLSSCVSWVRGPGGGEGRCRGPSRGSSSSGTRPRQAWVPGDVRTDKPLPG